MAVNRASAPDLVTLANLHAALDGVVEIEGRFEAIHLPLHASSAAKQLRSLAAEMRTLLADLLRPQRR